MPLIIERGGSTLTLDEEVFFHVSFFCEVLVIKMMRDQQPKTPRRVVFISIFNSLYVCTLDVQLYDT